MLNDELSFPLRVNRLPSDEASHLIISTFIPIEMFYSKLYNPGVSNKIQKFIREKLVENIKHGFNL